jgi:aminopeptidase-like protein
MSYMVWCVSWYDKNGEKHIDWNVPDPWFLEEKLIKDGINPETIDIYEKDVS